MSSIKTFLRTVVMLVTLGIVAKAWYLYGPSLGEMKTIGARAMEISQEAWVDYWQGQNNGPKLAGEPAPFVPPPVVAPIPAGQPGVSGSGTSTQAMGPVQLAGGAPPLMAAERVNEDLAPRPTRLPPAAGATLTPMEAPPQDDRLQKTLERLSAWGVGDQELGPWGSEGRLCRFSCSAPWANTSSLTRHFEAVAATPVAAVEQVAAEIAVWRDSR